MTYNPTNWQTGDTITAEKLNKIEGGIQASAHEVPIEVTGLIDVPLEAQPNVTFTIENMDHLGLSEAPLSMTFVKISDEVLTADDCIGGVITYGPQTTPVTAADITDLSDTGISGLSGISVVGAVWCISSASELVPSAGVYTYEYVIPDLDMISFSRMSTVTIIATPIPSYSGVESMTAGISDLPDNTIYMQVNPEGTMVENIYLGIDGKAAVYTPPVVSDIFEVVFSGDTANGTATCSQTYSDVLEAYNSGRRIKMAYNDDSTLIELSMLHKSNGIQHFFIGTWSECKVDLENNIEIREYASCSISNHSVICEISIRPVVS